MARCPRACLRCVEIKFAAAPTHWLISTQVLRLGGTFVVDDDTVRFAHADKFPGDHPAIADVLRAAGISLVDAEGVAV